MTLRKKAIAIIYGTLMGLCLALAALLGWQTVRSYSKLEREDMGQQISRAEKSLRASIDRIGSIAGDWAPWDESYYFLKGTNPGYVANNLSETAFMNLGISLVAFITPEGSVPWAWGFDNALGAIVPPPMDFHSFQPDDVLLLHPTVETGSAGLLRLSGNKLMIVASRPITTSDFSAPEIGSLVIGLMLDGTEVRRMSVQTSLELSIAPADAPDLGPDFKKARSRLVAGNSVFIEALDKDRVAGYVLLKDIYGRPAAVLRVSTPRSFHRQGVTSLWYIVLSLIITGLCSAVILTLIIDRLILGRLYRLGEEVSRIGDTRDLQARLVEEGSDEISALAATINSTLSELEASDLGLKASLSEKDLLLHEIHHRVKNNLQVVSSLLSLQSGMTKDEGARAALRESQSRIHSMALIHETLYQKNEDGTMDLGKIDFSAYLRHLSSYLADVYLIDRSLVGIGISGDEIYLDADTAITCGLIVNELISNSLKHAFPDGRSGTVFVHIGAGQEGGVVLAVTDDGIGLPPGFDPRHTSSMGWQLVSTLILQLKARLEVGAGEAEGQGTMIRFSFFPSGNERGKGL